jgi:hypothetical protein
MSKHTPGPWRTEFDSYGGYDCMTAGQHIRSDTKLICTVDYGNYGNIRFDESPNLEADANACLIAAAPELLEACKYAVGRNCGCHSSTDKDWHGQHCEIPRLRAAIIKAEGR